MRTSLNEIKLIDAHILGENAPGDALVFEARLILNPGLAEQTAWQLQTHGLIRQYGKKRVKAEIEAVHQKLFTQPQHSRLKMKILSLFGKK